MELNDILESQYFADFETTTEKNYNKEGQVRVYMWGLKDAFGNYWKGTTLNQFIDRVSTIAKQRHITIWFHNLKFDFSFIESFFLMNGKADFKHRKEMNKWTTWGKEYSTIRDGMNQLYGADWYLKKNASIKFRDSAKLYPMPLSALGEMVGVKKLAEQFDYEKYIPYGYLPTEKEWEYMEHDVEILRLIVVKQITKAKTVRMTRSGYAFKGLRDLYIQENTPENWDDLKPTLKRSNGRKFRKKDSVFEYHFPPTTPELYMKLKPAYFGGHTQLMPQYRSKVLAEMSTYDVNSEYPGVMRSNWFPIYEEMEFKGDYNALEQETKEKRPLYVQRFKAEFSLKEKGFPSLPKKASKDRKAVYSSDDLRGRGLLTLSNIDLEHFFINYDVKKITYLGGWHWQAVFAPFKNYIDLLAKEKIEAEEKGDAIGRAIAKLEMNGCYGKFAQSPFKSSKLSYLDEKDTLRFNSLQEPPEEQQYFPMGIFITAYARDTLFNGIYKAGMDRFVYCDTDSIHILGYEPVEGLEIHPTKLGAWKWEEARKDGNHDLIVKAKYLREKCYAHVHISSDKPDIKAAGLSNQAKGTIKEIAEFNLDQEYTGSFQQYLKKGGVLLLNTNKFLKDEPLVEGELFYLRQLKKETPSIEAQGCLRG